MVAARSCCANKETCGAFALFFLIVGPRIWPLVRRSHRRAATVTASGEGGSRPRADLSAVFVSNIVLTSGGMTILSSRALLELTSRPRAFRRGQSDLVGVHGEAPQASPVDKNGDFTMRSYLAGFAPRTIALTLARP